MPTKHKSNDNQEESRLKGLDCYSVKFSGCDSLTGKYSGTSSATEATNVRRGRTNSSTDTGDKKNRPLKNVTFNLDLNEYFEPKENTVKRNTRYVESVRERRNAMSVVKGDTYEVLRILSMYTSWRLAQAQKGRNYEQFAEFLGRASPKLFDKFFVNNQLLL